ncbi:hypothetical protein S40285_01755 [Stachybotrys chlorohalonatus IBT 40285]|uniref:Small ribosomal subunit protein mS23 n=1 Tax=Stachybotrys chlorohalonatus (strain IBT 40285) TaxID=1283841 RepID=A0A084R2B8_STAC4|nr:hypothetical protein S40285_01755 [Stachybotrys chlorohalonata IBT 40285]
MGGRQIRPAKVYNAVTQELQQSVLKGLEVAQPPWYQIMREVPPAQTTIRNVTPRRPAANSKLTKPRHMYLPQRIHFKEDALRANFYKDHPWELARPRIIMELDGKDYQYVDWSKGVRQKGIPLTGESVVQRQLWLMENEKMGREKAYDQARREFYRLRQEEEIEKRVALEEARHVGAYFNKSRMDVGMQIEDQQFENWKIWAGKEAAAQDQKDNAGIDSFDAPENPDDAPVDRSQVVEPLAAEAVPATAAPAPAAGNFGSRR